MVNNSCCNDQTFNKLDKLAKKLNLYKKKANTMGLSEKELIQFNNNIKLYISTKLIVKDDLFNKCILLNCMSNECIMMYDYFIDNINWSSELLLNEKKMSLVKDKFDNKSIKEQDKIIDLLFEYNALLLNDIKSYYDEFDDKEVFNDISMFVSDNTDNGLNALLDYTNYKFEVIYMLLKEGEE